MATFTSKRVALCASLACIAALSSAAAQNQTLIPDFSSNNAGWTGMGGMTAMPGSPEPVGQHPSRPLIGNIGRLPGQQPTFPYADLTNPNLTPFAREGLRKVNEAADAGFAMYSRESRCWDTGVPLYLNNPAQPTFFLQSPKQVTMIWQMDQQVRRVYLNVPHTANPKPSWYGESVGHYEGDTLVVDTIGQNTRSFLDNFRTPHSDKLHVVERYRLVDNGNTLEAEVTIDDPVALVKPLHLVKHWRKVVGPMTESRCADGEMVNPFGQKTDPIPSTKTPDF
jgi:hypothetical protein